MRNFLFGLSLTLGSFQAGFASCLDTTLVIANGAPGFATPGGIPTYTPAAGGAINDVIKNCTEATMTVHLKFVDAAHGDTLRLANEILVTGRSGKTTRIVGEGTGDSIVTLLETSVTDPQLIQVNASNATILSGLGFARKTIGPGPTGSNNSSVVILANGSQVVGCHFWMLDNSSQGTGALLDIQSDSTLVERCLFRAPPEGAGRSTGLQTGGTATRVEIRSNVFFSTGVLLAASGSVHVLANTFCGSRDARNAIIVGTTVNSPGTNVTIMHNLFANKVDLLPPIAFSGPVASSDSILRNAWSRGSANLALAVSGSTGTASITLNNGSGTNVNTPLPRGFSNYGPSSFDVKDYPLTQLRSEPTLVRKHVDFGKMFKVFMNSNWTGMADIKDVPAARLYFPSFTPFLAGKTWLPNVKVGAFVDQDGLETPAPLDSGARGSALKFDIIGDSTRIKVSKRSFDANYYKTTVLTPEFMYYFFSDTLGKLASNDSNALKTSTRNAFVRKTYLGDDSILTVPREVRNDRRDIFVKLLHYRQGRQAVVQSEAAIAQVSNVPAYPINDLALKVEGNSDFAGGKATITVTRGAEPIDSVRVVAANLQGQTVASGAKAATGSSLSFVLDVGKGTFVFYAVPLAKLGGVAKPGQPTANSAAFSFQISQNDTVYLSYKTGSCAGATGAENLPYCSMDSALNEIRVRSGTTIIVKNASPAVAMEDIGIAPTAAGDSTPLTITTLLVNNRYDVTRPIFRGKTKEALTITRKNVTLKGFFIEMPVGGANNAVNVKAGGVQIEGNLFRALAKGAVDGAAVNIDVGATADMRFLNNVVWAFTKNVQITNTASANVRVLNNTFVEDAALNPGKGVGINLVGTGALTAVFANNFFSGITNPIDASLKDKSPSPTLDHNVFTKKPDLRGLSEIGLDTSSYRLASTDIWGSSYLFNLENELTSAIDCNALSPCNPLYGGSSSTTYNTNVSTDFLGKPRVNRKEVGAYEFNSSPSSVLGVLDLDLSLVDNNYQRLNFVVTGKTFDPAAGEADSVHVWWSTTSLSGNIDPSLSTIPAIRQKHFPISKLGAGSFSDFADSIKEENRLYYFYAALGRTAVVGGTATRKLGYAYSAAIVSDINKDSADCQFKISNSVCPSPGGVFVPINPTYSGFQTQVTMTETVTSGVFKNPKFEPIPLPLVFNLDLTSPLPMIIFSTQIAGLGVPGSAQMFRASITFDGTPNMEGKELFLIPTDPKGMASLVSSWSLKQENGKTTITIESSMDGTQQYAFGKVQASMEPGTITTTDAAPPVFDFEAAKDSSVLHIPVKFKGSDFKTANPLVLISLVPSGGSISGVLNGTKHHSSTLALTMGYAALKDSLRDDRFYKYYLKAVATEAASTVAGGHHKPFVLDSVSMDDFLSATRRDTNNLAIVNVSNNPAVARGDLGEITVSIPVSKAFKDFDRYADKTGKASRSLEVEYTVFDGAKISRSRSFIRTKFTQKDLGITDNPEFSSSSSAKPRWNLFGYPWVESSDPNLARVLAVSKWDHDHARLMQYKGAGTGASSFNAYDGSNPDAIKLDSGRAVWSGSTGSYRPNTAGGMSLDYQPFSLALNPGQWNDFALPFNFPITWKDILDSSGVANANDVPAWRFMPETQTWEALTKGSASPAVPGSVLLPWQGFSAKPATAVTLKFPLLDSARSATKTAPKAAAKTAAGNASPGDGSWTARVLATNGTVGMSLRIGKGAREAIFPEAPDVPGQDFRVALKRVTPAGEENVSQYIQAQDGSWQGHWALRAVADKGAKGISLRVADAGKEIPLYLVDVLHQSATPLSAEAPIEISPEELRANDYHVVAGDDQYLQNVLHGLVPLHLLALSNYPNPFAGSTLIRYALPESFGKVSFDLKVRDFRGRTVWERTLKGGNSLSYLWDGLDKMNSPLPAGVYTLSLEAAAVGKPVFRANRRMLRM